MAYDIKLAKVLVKQFLLILQNQIVLPNLVHRDFQNEIGKQGKTIEIPVAPTFTANAMDNDNGITIQDPDEDSIEMTLDNHWEVSFGVRDLEATVSDRKLLEQYMLPAMIPLIEKIETTGLAELTYNITQQASIGGVTNAYIDADKIVDIRTAMRANKVPLMDMANLSGLLSPKDEGALLKQEKFTNQLSFNADSDAVKRAHLGQRYGFNYYPTQLIMGPTPGDVTGAINNGTVAVGTTDLTVDGFTAAVPEGALVTLADDTNIYVADAGCTTTSLKLKSGLLVETANDKVVTVLNVNQNVFFHKHAIALAMRPLETASGQKGGSTIMSAGMNGYGVRVEIFRDSNKKKDVVSIDALWGWKMLNQKLAYKYYTQK